MNDEVKMTSVQAQRLLNVATALREAPKEIAKLFDMHKFGYGFIAHRIFGRPVNKPTLYNCNTPACSLGHYAVRTDMQHVFRLNKNGRLVDHEDHELAFADDIILEHFGVSYPEAARMFNADGCGQARTTTQAATFIEKFLDSKGWEFNRIPVVRRLAA